MFKSNSIKSSICFWDKQPFTGKPVKCPLYLKSKQTVIKKKEYYINHNIPEFDKKEKDNVHRVIEKTIVFNDVFCSNECCLAYINDLIDSDPIYRSSKIIFLSENSSKIRPANHWRTLDVFGGFLTIKEFRSNNRKFKLVQTNVIKKDEETSLQELEFEEIIEVS